MQNKTYSLLKERHAVIGINLYDASDSYVIRAQFSVQGDLNHIMDLYETVKDECHRTSFSLLILNLKNSMLTGIDLKLGRMTEAYNPADFPKDKMTLILVIEYSPEKMAFRTFQQELGKFVIGEPADIPRFIEILETLDQALDADN